MNLKEAFRYQRFLDNMMNEASSALTVKPSVVLITTKTHKKNVVNTDDEDWVEEEDRTGIPDADKVLHFMDSLVKEKEDVTNAVGKAKQTIGFDFDTAVETNKFRRTLNSTIKQMSRWKPSNKTIQGHGYKWNVEGNQMSYCYDIEVKAELSYSQEKAKKLMKEAIEKADEVSVEIDKALVETELDFEPSFNVNDSFEEILESFNG